MSEPRTRTAAEVADHAAALVDDARTLSDDIVARYGNGTRTNAQRLAELVERLAAQVEDLAAVADTSKRTTAGPYSQTPTVHRTAANVAETWQRYGTLAGGGDDPRGELWLAVALLARLVASLADPDPEERHA